MISSTMGRLALSFVLNLQLQVLFVSLSAARRRKGSSTRGGIIHILQKAHRAVPGCPPGQYAPGPIKRMIVRFLSEWITFTDQLSFFQCIN